MDARIVKAFVLLKGDSQRLLARTAAPRENSIYNDEDIKRERGILIAIEVGTAGSRQVVGHYGTRLTQVKNRI